MSRFVLTAQLQLQAPNNVAQVVRQIQSQLNGVTVNVQVQGAPQAQRQIQQIANQTNQAASAAERMGKAFAVSVRRFAAFSIATRAVGLFTSTLSDAVQTAIDFERQMVKVSQVTGDSLAKLRGLTKTITGLSTGLGVSSASLLEVSTVLLQAGLSAKDTEVALKSLARAALAPNFDSITETAEGAIAILAQFQEGVGSLEKQLGSINAVAGAFAVEASDLIDVIRRTGGVFKASGGSLNELLALFTSVRATTRESAESIGTGLRTIFTRIQRPKTIEFLKQFGVELVDLEGKFVGPFEAVKRLSAALSGLGEGDITFIRIAEELGGFRQIGKVLPLLQQFSTAQAALNVATKAGNSLAQDAATAQQALAIRIIKVKEEFLALVRSITETSTFQIMASTALSLASALIKISEAIKPLLPLLGALAAFKIAKGFGTFVGSVAGGLQSGRTFNQGGRVHKFARGGMVPGTGNRDTVPAMLQPGEFVIRKSSVNRLGAGTLHAMNENRYAAGGRVNVRRNFYGSVGPDGRSLVGKTKGLTLQEAVSAGFKRSQLSSAYGADAVNKALGTAAQGRSVSEKAKTKTRKAAKTPTDEALKQQYPGGVFRTVPGAIGGFFLTPESGTDSPYTLSAPYPFDLNGQKAAIAPGSTISNFVPFRSDLKKNARLNNIIDNSAKRGLIDSIQSAAPKVNSFLDITPAIDFNEQNVRGAAAKLAKDQQVVSTIGGYLFEGIIQGVTGAQLAGGRTSFDFPSVANVKDKLASMFTTSEGSLLSLLKADAKRSKNPKTNMSIVDKLRQDIQKGDLSGVMRLATGGPVGTDTVPALLTPGEFVVNRASAKKIGYSNLNRMNKVGKYAKGGTVQRFQTGGVATPMGAPGSLPNMNAATASVARFVDTTDRASDAQTKQRRSIGEVVQSNKFFALSMTTSLIQGFLPALDENSGALNRVTHSMLGLATTIASVGFALEAFGVQLNGKQLLDFFSGIGGAGSIASKAGSYARAGVSGLSRAADARGLTSLSNSLLSLTGPTKNIVSGFVRLAGPLAGTAIAITGINTLFKALFDNTANLKKAIERGDVAGATSAARGQVNLEGATAARNVGGGIGAIVGTFLGGPIGTAIGGAIGAGIGTLIANTPGVRIISDSLNQLFGGQNRAVAIAYANVQANATKTAKAFEERQKAAGLATQRLEEGSISAAEALLEVASAGGAQIQAQAQAFDNLLKSQEASKTGTLGGIGRGALRIGTLGIAGLLGVESGAGRNARIDKEIAQTAQERRQFQTNRFESLKPQASAAIRSGIVRGQDQATIESTLKRAGIASSAEIRSQIDSLKAQQQAAQKSGNKQQAETIGLDIAALEDQAKFLEDSFKNLAKEVELAKKKFEAINLGFKSVTANSEVAALRLNNFVANLEVGAVPVQQAVSTLEASLTSAGQAISANEVNSAIDEVSGVFRQFGATEQEIQKFSENIGAVAQVQRSFPNIIENIKANIKAGEFKGEDFAPESLKKQFAEQVSKQLEGTGPEVKDRILAVIEAAKLDEQAVEAVMSGDYSALETLLKDAGEEAQKVMKEVVDNYAKVHQQLIELTKRRIEAERNYIEAQKEALSIQMEARELQGKYGGTAVTNAERQANVLARANVGAGRLGLSNLATGGTDELRRRNDEIRQRFAAIEGGRRVEGGMAGREGVTNDAIQADLEKASKDQISTIRELIKIQEDELKIIQEKNKLEKDSLDALIAGDVDKFFEQQAAVGATAAIATGNETLMQSFGAKALGAAYTDIQRQQEAGVQELYGIRLAGAGGLTERAAGASLAARGVTDPRAAQMAARTTAEEEKINANIRGLSQELADAGQVQADLAAMRLDTANINVQQAEIKLAGGETLKVGGPSAPSVGGGGGGGTGGAGGAATGAAATSAAGRAGASGAGGAGRSGSSGGVGGTGGATGTAGVGVQDVAAAGQANNGDIFGSIRYGAGLGAAAYTYGPTASNMARGAGGQFRAGMDVAKIGLGKDGLSRVGKLGYGFQNFTTPFQKGFGRARAGGQGIVPSIGRGLYGQAQSMTSGGFGRAVNYGQTQVRAAGIQAQRFGLRAQQFAQPFTTGFTRGRAAGQGILPSIGRGLYGQAQSLTSGGFGRTAGAIGNRLSPYTSTVSGIGQRAFKAVGGDRLVSGASRLANSTGVQGLGKYASNQVRAAGIQAQRLGLRASPMLGKAGSFAATQGRAAMIQAQRLGLRALPMAQNALSAAGTAGSNLVKGFNVGRSGLANVGGMFGQQAAKTAGSTLAGKAGLLGGQTLAKVASSGAGKFAGSLLTKGGGLGLGTAISGVTNAAEFLYDPSAYNAKMQGKSDAGLARAQSRDTAGFAYDSLAGAAEGFVDPVGKLVEAGYVMKDFTKDALAASEASAKTERMKAATVDDTGLNVQERTWAKEQAMRENQLASAQAKGDQTGVAQAQKELKDLEARRVQERTANDWLPSMLSGAGTDTAEYKKYVEQQKVAQKAQEEAALQQEAQAKATTEAAAAPMSTIPPVPLVSAEQANALLNQSGVQAMQASQTQAGRASSQTLAGGTITNQAAGTTAAIEGAGGIDPEIVNKLMATLDKFNVDLSANIDKLANTNLSIKLDATNINVNLNGGDFLAKLTKDVQQAVLQEVSNKLQNASIGNDGKLKLNSGSLPGSPSAPTSSGR